MRAALLELPTEILYAGVASGYFDRGVTSSRASPTTAEAAESAAAFDPPGPAWWEPIKNIPQTCLDEFRGMQAAADNDEDDAEAGKEDDEKPTPPERRGGATNSRLSDDARHEEEDGLVHLGRTRSLR